MKTKRVPDRFKIPSFRGTLSPTVQGKFSKAVESMADLIVDEIFAGKFSPTKEAPPNLNPWLEEKFRKG